MRLFQLFAFTGAVLFAANFSLSQEPGKRYFEQVTYGYFDAEPVSDKATAEKSHELEKHGVINFDIYRDCERYPIDPRKPCHICVQRKGKRSKFKGLTDPIYGFQGRPYSDVEPGACRCGKKKQKFKFTNMNVYWPKFLAGVREDKFPCWAAKDAATFDRFRLVDSFDWLGGFELSCFQRKDNGYCGPGYDRYGCLGESRLLESDLLDFSNCGCGEGDQSGCEKGGVCNGRNGCGYCKAQ